MGIYRGRTRGLRCGQSAAATLAELRRGLGNLVSPAILGGRQKRGVRWRVKSHSHFSESRDDLSGVHQDASQGERLCFKYLVTRAFANYERLTRSVFSPYRDLSDADLAKQIRGLETKLGVPYSEPEVLPRSDKAKPN